LDEGHISLLEFITLAHICDNRLAQINLAVSLDANCWQPNWGRLGFDAGIEAERGMPRSSHLVNPLETINANDERYALAA